MRREREENGVTLSLTVQEKRISLPAYTDRDTDTCSPAVTDNSTSFHTKLISKFHFVDLAGSERVDRTHNTGERFKGIVATNDIV